MPPGGLEARMARHGARGRLVAPSGVVGGPPAVAAAVVEGHPGPWAMRRLTATGRARASSRSAPPPGTNTSMTATAWAPARPWRTRPSCDPPDHGGARGPTRAAQQVAQEPREGRRGALGVVALDDVG